MMDSNLTWTSQLGEAFLDQQSELMDAIQTMRSKAYSAGTLRATPQQEILVTNMVVLQTNVTQVVTVTNQVVEIYPSNPQVVYVPTYPPYVYYPPPAYVYNPLAPLITFGAGVAVGAIIANNCNWYHGGGGVYVGPRGAVAWSSSGSFYRGGNVNVYNNYNVNRNVNVNNNRNVNVNNNMQKWQPDQNRVRSSGAGGAAAGTREARGWGSGGGQASAGTRPSTGSVGARPSTGAVGTRPSTGNLGGQPSTGARPAPTTSTFQSGGSGNRGTSSSSAFSGVNSGSAERSYSDRGTASRSSGGYSGGYSGGSRGGFSGGGGRGGGGGRR
jgi:hypothetical protein